VNGPDGSANQTTEPRQEWSDETDASRNSDSIFRGRMFRYGLAAAAVAVAVLLRIYVQAELVKMPPLTYFAAVAIVAWLVGMGPALLTATGCVAVLALRSETGRGSSDVAGFVLLYGVGIGLAVLSRAMWTARERAAADAAAALRRQRQLEAEVAERERAEQALQRATSEREALLRLTETARTEAETASRSKDEFLAMLSHELRSPLQAMVGWLAALRCHRNDAQVVGRALDALERSLKVQGELVNDLLDVSRIISGKLTLDRSWVDAAAAVVACVDLARAEADGKGLEIRFDSRAAPVPVMGDAARLQQMVNNLLNNAMKFTPVGGCVDVRVTQRGSECEIVVADSGEGVDPEALPHIFERFRQADSKTTRAHGGLGLGLTIVRHLAEAHGGRVEGFSEGKGLGATFRILLPLAPLGRMVEVRSNAVRDLELRGARILLVDDDRSATEALGLALQHYGAVVAQASSAREALNRLQSEPFDLVISDIGMPGESGYTLARAIRAHEDGDGHRTPLLAVTGFASREDEEEARRAGFDDHVAKPVDVPQLIERIRLLVEAAHSAHPS
jgi:signal transduction histidine kinase/ActR/RegA family two-component response regulator